MVDQKENGVLIYTALQELQQERDRYQELLAKLKQQGVDTDNL